MKRTILFSCLCGVLLGLCIYFFYYQYSHAKENALAEMNTRQITRARLAQQGIQTFLTDTLTLLTTLSAMAHMADFDERGREALDVALRVKPNAIMAMIRMNALGEIVYSAADKAAVADGVLPGRNCFQRILKTRQPAASDVFTTAEGNNAMALQVPVFKNGEFRGTLGALIDMMAVLKPLLMENRPTGTEYAWMTSPDGIVIDCQGPGGTGKSASDTDRAHPAIVAVAKEIGKGKEGSTHYRHADSGNQRSDAPMNAVCLPVTVADSVWTVGVATSEDELLIPLVDIKHKLVIVAGISIFATVLISFYGLKAFGIVREAAARQRAEDALRESEKTYRELFELAPVGIFKTDSNGRALFANTEMARILGATTHKEVIDRFQDLAKDLYVDEDRRKAFIRLIQEAGVVENFEYEARRLDGKRVWLSMNARAQKKSATGNFLIDGFTTDITDRKQTEVALRENEEIFNQLMEHSPIYVFFKDDKIRSIRLSRNYERLLGRPIHELLGKTMDDLFPSDLAKGIIADDMRILKEGKVIHVDEEFNGRQYTTTKFPIYLDGKPRYLAGYTIDITDRIHVEAEKRRLEERLQRAEKMEALGTLAGGVAHDLNNVLGVVTGYAELLLSDIHEGSSLKPRLAKILDGGQRAAAIVQDLLTLARRGVPGKSVLNLNRVIGTHLNSLEFADMTASHPAVKVRTELEPDLLNIAGSSVHLGKTLSNLILNAVEAMPYGGSLLIRTANRYLDKPIQGYDEIREGDYVVLSVSDTGEGISRNDAKRIFEPFYTKKVMGRSGTGLGLAVVWGTVKDHCGYINLQSEAGKGSTFTLYFPVTREALMDPSDAMPISRYMGTGESILVVDDVEEQRELVTAMLKKLNYQVASAASGKDAISWLQANSADLLVLDMIMEPGLDGLDTYRRVLEIRPRQKAIIVSGFSESERVSAAQALGAGAYVRKPYLIENLGLAIRKELDSDNHKAVVREY